MEEIVKKTHFVFRLALAMVLTARCPALASGQSVSVQRRATEVQPPHGKESNPKLEDATTGILAAFDRYEVVGMGAAHGNKDLDDPTFPSKVSDIVVECGNSLYQGTLDRYIAGEDVPLSEARQVWRNTTASMCSVSGFYEVLFPLVRRINQRLPPRRRLRMLAGDPPVDWSTVKERSGVMRDRDATAASVMQKEVLSKNRKALMLFGTFHLFHSNSSAPRGLESAVQSYEKEYPGRTFVIGDALVFAGSAAPANDEWRVRMASWPAPVLVQNIKGTWLEEVDQPFFSKMVDAYLYLGPPELMLVEPRPAEIFSNKDYMAELRRRAAIIGDDFVTNQTNPDALSDQDFSPFLFP
jgi:hypothetical protein